MPETVHLACLHSHTNFCDGKTDVETMCRAAFDKGLSALGFSSHAPVERKTGFPPTGWTMDEGRLEEYLEAVRAAKKRWEGRLTIFLGLEVDFIPGLMGPADSDYRGMDLDYIIGSVHFVLPPKGAPFTVDAPGEELERGIREGYGGDAAAVTAAYYDSLEALIKSGGFDILGHPDLVKKSNQNSRLFEEGSEFYRTRCKAAAALAGKHKVTIEVNTGGMNRGYADSPYPSFPLLKLFRENNVPAAINADAHRPEDLDGNYPAACKAMLAAGFAETVLFQGRKNNVPVWRPVKL